MRRWCLDSGGKTAAVLAGDSSAAGGNAAAAAAAAKDAKAKAKNAAGHAYVDFDAFCKFANVGRGSTGAVTNIKVTRSRAAERSAMRDGWSRAGVGVKVTRPQRRRRLGLDGEVELYDDAGDRKRLRDYVYHGDNEYCKISDMKSAVKILARVVATCNNAE